MKEKRIELVIKKRINHKPVLTTENDLLFTTTIDYKMPKGYGNSIKTNVKIKYITRANEEYGNVFLVLGKAKK